MAERTGRITAERRLTAALQQLPQVCFACTDSPPALKTGAHAFIHRLAADEGSPEERADLPAHSNRLRGVMLPFPLRHTAPRVCT